MNISFIVFSLPSFSMILPLIYPSFSFIFHDDKPTAPTLAAPPLIPRYLRQARSQWEDPSQSTLGGGTRRECHESWEDGIYRG
jgi:hypothetical protein